MRKLFNGDRELFIALVREFYRSEAVIHAIPEESIEATFCELMRSDEYAECFILELGGNAAGYALIAKTFSQEAGGKVAWIEELYVRPEFRGMGLGSAFLREFENLSKDVKRLRLEIEPANARAEELYKRCGFSALGYKQMYKEL